MGVSTMYFVYDEHPVHVQIGRKPLQLGIFARGYDVVSGVHSADVYDGRASVVLGKQHEKIDIVPLPLKLLDQREIGICARGG